jgi:hypothetical protein
MKITTFDWSVIMIGSGGDLSIVSHFMPFNFSGLWVLSSGMLFAWLFCQVDVSHFARFKLPKGKHP